MELKIPTPEQAYWGLRVMKTIALADGALDDSELHMMEVLQRIFATTYSQEELAPIAPADLAQAFPDPQLRRQLVQGLIVMSLIDREASPQETDLVEQFAQALDVSISEVKDLRYLLRGEILRLRLDLARRFWLKEKVIGIWNSEGLRGIYKLVRGLMGKYENAELAARYQAKWVRSAGGKGWRAGTNSVSRLRAYPIGVRNGSRRRGSGRLFQCRLSAPRPLYLHSLRPSAVPCGYSFDAHH